LLASHVKKGDRSDRLLSASSLMGALPYGALGAFCLYSKARVQLPEQLLTGVQSYA